MIERLNAALEGRYRIERELGEGGMATVYLAEDLRHDRKVALKVLKPELAAVVGAERFLTEIKTTAQLQHPHILPLHDSGEADSFLFYVMPYVEGESLRDTLDREKQLAVEAAVSLTEKIASALQYAHEQGVVHRDIKPANILLSRGDPLVADFGIALALSEAGGGRITETGLSLGTPHYMSPEQASGDQSLDRRSDVYALGCVLYEMLTGEPPYGGPTAQSVLAKILTGDARRITELRRTVPPNVDAAVAKALEKLPADRFDSADSFVRALEDTTFRHATGPERSTRRAPGVEAGWRARGRLRTVAIATAALVAGLALGFLLRRPPPEEPVFRATLDFPDDQELFDLPYGSSLLMTPDGSRLLYAGPGETRGWRLWSRPADALEATPIRGTDGAGAAVLSPTGDALAYADISDGDLMVIDLRGGSPRKVASLAAFVTDWTESGYIYFADYNLRNLRVSAGGGEPEVVPGLANPPDWSVPGSPAWTWGDVLPGDKLGVYSRTAESNDVTENAIAVVDLETGEYRELAQGTDPRYLGDGRLVWVTLDGILMASRFDAKRGELSGPAVPVIDGIRTDPTGAATMAAAPTGDLVYVTGDGRGGSMQVVRVDGEGRTTPIDEEWWLLPAAAGNWSGLAVSPDGSKLVVTNGAGGGSQLWVKNLGDDSPPNRITFEGDFHVRPRWLPGSDSVLFISSLGGEDRPTEVWAKAADGSGEPRRLAATDVEIEEALVSPDGHWLVYRQGGTTANRDIYALRRDVDSAGRPLVATEADEKSPRLSPDGRWLAYISDQTGRHEVFVRPFPDVSGGRWQISRGGGLSPVWSPDGSRLHYVASDGTLTAAHLRFPGTSVGVARREPLFGVGEEYVDLNYPAIESLPDGETFLLLSFRSGEAARVVWVRNWLSEWERRMRAEAR